MESSELISLIVPVYNIEAYLPRCLETIAAQTYSNIEIVLVDDGSRDSSAKICDDFARVDSRVKVIHQPNAGLWAARNSGKREATGKYVMFVDGDDYLHLDAVRQMHDAITSGDYDIAIMDRVVTNRLDEDVESPCDGPTTPLTRDELMARLFDHKIWEIYIYQWNKLYKRSLIENIWCREYINAEDFDYNLRIYQHTERAVLLNKRLYYYVQRDGSLVHRSGSFRTYYRCMTDILYNSYKELPDDRAQYKNYIIHELYIFMNHMIKCEWNTGERFATCNRCQQMEREVRLDYFNDKSRSSAEKIARVATVQFPRLVMLLRGLTFNRISFSFFDKTQSV